MAKIMVDNFSAAFTDLALNFLGKRSFFRNGSLLSKFMLNVMFLLKYFTSVFRLYFNFRGVMIGEKHKEYGIAQNQKVFLYGEFLYDKVSKLLKGGSLSSLLG